MKMKTEKEIKEKIRELKEERIKLTRQYSKSTICNINKKIAILEWVLED